jgi:3-hydroxypropanoate dehydrogenase
MPTLSSEGLDLLFRNARTFNSWTSRPIDDDTLQSLYDLLKMGPTAVNGSPARIVFLRSEEAKSRLAPALNPPNIEKTIAAPITAIIGYDTQFFDHLPELFPHVDARSWFASDPALSEVTAFRSGTLQGAYLMLAARALGLDCGPMSGFDNAKVDREFFPNSTVKSNFLCNLGYGQAEELYPRNPRLAFHQACSIL